MWELKWLNKVFVNQRESYNLKFGKFLSYPYCKNKKECSKENSKGMAKQFFGEENNICVILWNWLATSAEKQQMWTEGVADRQDQEGYRTFRFFRIRTSELFRCHILQDEERGTSKGLIIQELSIAASSISNNQITHSQRLRASDIQSQGTLAQQKHVVGPTPTISDH